MKTGFKPDLNYRTVIALALLVISFLMLFVPWIDLHAELSTNYSVHGGRGYTFDDVINEFAYLEDLTPSQMKSEFEYDLTQVLINDLKWEAEDYNIPFHVTEEQLIRTVRGLYNGKISVPELARAATLAYRLTRTAVLLEEERWGEASEAEYRLVKGLRTASVLLWIIIVLFIIAFVIAGAAVLTGSTEKNRSRLIPYAGLCIILLIACIISVNKGNEAFISYELNLHDYVADLLEDFDIISNWSDMGERVFYLTSGGYWCVILALLAFGATWLPDKLPLSDTKAVIQTNWICPECGSRSAMTAAFCKTCGTPKPQAKRCTKCGKVLQEDERYCSRCGTPSAQEQTIICRHCGASLEIGATFCTKCGKGPVSEPMKIRMKTCAGCGRENPESAQSCSYCGNSFVAAFDPWSSPDEDDL